MAEKQKYSVQERARMFAQATRQNLQMIPEKMATNGATTLQFDFPKARLLSKALFDVEVEINIKHATLTAVPVDDFTCFKVLRRLSLDLNNGFSPFVIGGKELAIYNCIRMKPETVFPQKTNPRGYNYMPDLTASTAGKDNSFHFTMELPVTLNDRDPIGLILLQSPETNVQLSVDIANGGDILDNASGYTVEIKSVKIRPMLETFSLPAVTDAYPDISVLKIVNSRSDSFNGAGQNIIKLSTGTIYRKLAFYIVDENGKPFEDTDITSDIELVFNQADTNYRIAPKMFAHYNELQLGYTLPKGVFVFDFSNQGIPGYGGTRDYIDTEQLTELWLRFSSNKRGKIVTISETLSRLA